MNEPHELKVALVGCGGGVRNYRKAYAPLPGVQVIVTIATDEAEARQAAAETGAAKSSATFSDALAKGAVASLRRAIVAS